MYFEKSGRVNTEQTALCVAEYVKNHDIKHVVLASNTGESAKIFLKVMPDIQLTVVTHVIGMLKNGEDEMDATVRAELNAQKNIRLVTATHALSGAERAISSAYGGAYPVEIISQTLRMFGAGVKVAVECASMALDNGAIPYGVDIIAVGGTVRGSDSAILMQPAHASRIFETVIREILCKPSQFVSQMVKIKPSH